MGAYSFRSSPVAASFEFEEDSFTDVLQLLATCFSVGLARGIGPYLQNGLGASGSPPQPTGLYQALQANGPAVTTASPTAITADELLGIFHSVDKLHRNSPKAAWVMSDPTWLLIRQTAAVLGGANQSAWRFIMSDAPDDLLLGKKVLIDPNLPSGPSSPIIFGDLSHYVVRLTDLRVRRNIETTYITSAQALYTSLIRCDANLIAPGADRPVQYGIFYS